MGGAYRCKYTRKSFRTLYNNLYGLKRVSKVGGAAMSHWTTAAQSATHHFTLLIEMTLHLVSYSPKRWSFLAWRYVHVDLKTKGDLLWEEDLLTCLVSAGWWTPSKGERKEEQEKGGGSRHWCRWPWSQQVPIPLPWTDGVGGVDEAPKDGIVPVAARGGGHGKGSSSLQALQGHGSRVFPKRAGGWHLPGPGEQLQVSPTHNPGHRVQLLFILLRPLLSFKPSQLCLLKPHAGFPALKYPLWGSLRRVLAFFFAGTLVSWPMSCWINPTNTMSRWPWSSWPMS